MRNVDDRNQNTIDVVDLDSDLQIEQIRINTMQGDFIFDVVPEDGSSHLEAAVISHVNLVDQIVFLTSQTSEHFIEPNRLRKCLLGYLGRFEVPSKQAATRGSDQ
jgi:hypothetical protein